MSYVLADKWTDDMKQRIVEHLQAKHVKSSCPMCGNPQFGIADGYFTHTVQNSLQALAISGTTLPTVVLICTNCGFVSQHALGVLGFFDAPAAGERPK